MIYRISVKIEEKRGAAGEITAGLTCRNWLHISTFQSKINLLPVKPAIRLDAHLFK